MAICLPFSLWDRIDAIAGLCEEEGKIVRIPMDVMDRAISAGRVEELDGTPVFSLVSGPGPRRSPSPPSAASTSLGAAVGLVILSPVLAVIAVAIALDGGRPVLFRQTRIGLHGRPFAVVKFRSMVVDAEARRAELADRNALSGPGVQARRATRGSRGSDGSFGARRSTSCRSCGTCSAAR